MCYISQKISKGYMYAIYRITYCGGSGRLGVHGCKKRGYKTLAATGWMMGVFLLMIVFLPIYLIMRTRQAKQVEILTPCKYCGKYYEGTPLYCPNCGHKVGGYSFKEE
ncbi:MAG: hypothetical protein UZ01_03663 [Candidatus Brocadia sinica]|nr:MAG: hypothetical protein UZ01_03663 [Candidatus Brocadia sinica]